MALRGQPVISKPMSAKGRKPMYRKLRRRSTSKRRCQHCEVAFFSAFCLKLHINIHKKTLQDKSRFQCLGCGKFFKEMANFLRHRMFHKKREQTERNSMANSLLEVCKPGMCLLIVFSFRCTVCLCRVTYKLCL